MGLKFGELIILLLIVVLLFGSKKLPELGGSIGEAIKNFKKGIGGTDDQKKIAANNQDSLNTTQKTDTIDAQISH